MLRGNLRPKFFEAISRHLDAIVVVIAVSVFCYAARNAYSGLGKYGDWYDQGVYLESARLMIHGFRPYKDIFDSQPPLWLPLLSLSFHLFGTNLLAGQILTATSGLIVLIAVVLAAGQVNGRAAGLGAGLLIVLSPTELEWSRVVVAEVPFAALASVGMALAIRYVRNGNRFWLVAATSLIACSILIKVLGLFVLPALVALVIARGESVAGIDRYQRLRLIAGDMAIIAGTSAAIVGSCLLPSHSEMWNQVVTFHFVARSVYPSLPIPQRIYLIARFMKDERLLLAALPLAVLCLLGGYEGAAILAWPAFTFLGLMYQRPLFSHHMIALIPAVAVAAGVGAGYCGALSAAFFRWCATRSNRMRTAWQAAYVAAALAVAVVLFRAGWLAANQQEIFVNNVLDERKDVSIAQTIDQNTGPGEMVATDAQSVAFLAERDVPPELADTSFLRIQTSYLSSEQFIRASEKYHVRLLLFWTGRLNTVPGLVQWARANFPRRLDFGNGRILYMSADPSTKR
jgi:hypothetical protein